MRRLLLVCELVALVLLTRNASAQFSPALLRNDSYWADGKAEYNIYGAQIPRYGVPRECEVLHILVREPFDPKQLVKPDDVKRPEAINVLKLNQILHVPAGLEVYQQMHSNFWRVDNAQLLKFSLTSNDSCGNTYKEARRNGGTGAVPSSRIEATASVPPGDQFTYEWRTYWDGMASGQEDVKPPANGYFYDELPWLVRTIDFAKPAAEYEIQLAGSVINSKKDTFTFQPAKVSFTSTERAIDVTVKHSGGTDHFILDRGFPNLLREWNAADGTKLKMKRNIKVDYWNYNKPGDRERALNNPMLRLPD